MVVLETEPGVEFRGRHVKLLPTRCFSPLRIVDSNIGEVFYIFTDASSNCESKEGSIGGVLMNQ